MKRTLLTCFVLLVTATAAWAGEKAETAGYSLPKEWKKVKYARKECLPDVRISMGTATIRARVVGYKPDKPMSLAVYGFRPVNSSERFMERYPIDPDGTVTARIPLDMMRQVTVDIEQDDESYDSDGSERQTRVIIAPGQETEMLINLIAAGTPYQAFRGYMARTNRELTEHYFVKRANQKQDAQNLYGELCRLQTPEQRLLFFKDRLSNEKHRINRAPLTEASRSILRMEAEFDYMYWVKNFVQPYIELLDHAGVEPYPHHTVFKEKVVEYTRLMPLEMQDTVSIHPADYDVMTRRYAPISRAFWDFPAFDGRGSDPYLSELRYLDVVTNPLSYGHYDHFVEHITSEDCLAVLHDFQARQQQVRDELAHQSNVFLHDLDPIPADSILSALLSRYPGQPVLIDVWATWDDIFREAHQEMASLRPYLMEQGVAFVHVALPSTPLRDWQDMLQDIPGDHYRLSFEQHNALMEHFGGNLVPTYALFDDLHRMIAYYTGFPGTEAIRRTFAQVSKADE